MAETATAASATPDLDAVIERMDHRLDELRRIGDRRERFLLMYRTFKGELRRNLQEGRFADREWAEAICCRMGEMYFEADDAYRADPTLAPAPWALCFDSAVAKRTNLLQDMLLGMNAHINYDLPLCTYDVMDAFGDTAELSERATTSLRFRRLLRRRYYDFLLINEIAWESIPLIQDVVCDRFNRLLKYANLLSFRFTRHVTERIICQYRDRAWAHTLVFLTSPGDRGFAATRRHLSLFALRAADQVERLTLNPFRHLGGRDRWSADPAATRNVARVLVENLGYRPTRAIARQALEEYGTDMQPVIIRTLDQAPPLAPARAELYRVLAAHPTPDAIDALARALGREREVLGALLEAAADAADAAADPAPLREPALEAARAELGRARHLLQLTGSAFEGTILGEVLRSRIHEGLCRAARALRAAGAADDDEVPPCEMGRRRLPEVPTLAGRAHWLEACAERGTDPERAPASEPGAASGQDGDRRGYRTAVDAVEEAAEDVEEAADPSSTDAAVLELLQGADAWVRACAAWWIGVTGRRSLAPHVVDRVHHDDHELVKETALAAVARMLPGDEVRQVARALLERHTYAEATPARQLAKTLSTEDEATMITNIEKVLHLKNVTLFQDVLAEDLVTIARVAKEHRFRTGDQLIREGEPGQATYVIVEGEVRVTREGKELATVGPDGVLGEMSVVSDMPTSADCVAASGGLALRIDRADFHALLQDYPTTAIGVMHVLAERLRDTNVLAVD